MNALSREEPSETSSVATAVPLNVESALDQLREAVEYFNNAVRSVRSALAPEPVSGEIGFLICLSLILWSAEATQT